ncbi:MAG: EamA family transporter [Rickettsiales bacterium]|jgi:drug/metabolite transporter (DMT)-like permease|nr:EamA family transporter [Rickettsiales bacterium]
MFLLAVFISLLSPIAYAASTVTDSHLANKSFRSGLSPVFYGAPASMLLLPLLFLFGTPEIPDKDIWPALLFIGFTTMAYQIPYFTALRKTDTSIINALFAMGKVLIPVLAYFMVNERLAPIQYVGFALITIASVTLSLSPGKFGKLNSALYLMIPVAVLEAFGSVLEKIAIGELSWIGLAFWTEVIANAFIMTILLHKKSRREILRDAPMAKKGFHFLVLTNLFTLAGLMTQMFAISVLPVTVDRAIHSSQPFWALLFGILLFRVFKRKTKEKTDLASVLKKTICFAVILTGIVLAVNY